LPSRWGISSSSSHEVAFDGAPGDNSPFATCLLAALEANTTPLGIRGLAAEVENRMQAQRAKQTPICLPFSDPNRYNGQFYFHPKQNEASVWAQAQRENSIAAYEDFLKIFPNSDYEHDALLALLAITILEAEKEWQAIEVMPDEKESQVLDKLRAIDIYLSKITVDVPTFQKAENLGEVLNYKQDFLKAFNNLFALRKFARQETPFQTAASKRITELEARLRQDEKENENKRAAEIRRQTEEKAAQEEAERKRQAEQQKETLRLQETQRQKQAPLGKPREWAIEESTIPAPRRKSYLPYGIGGFLLLIFILTLINNWGGSDTPPEQNSTENTTSQTSVIEPAMVSVPGDTFQMGSNNGETDEKPVHAVTVSDFYISKYEVTFDEYDAFCEATKREKPDDRGWGRRKRPVINVS